MNEYPEHDKLVAISERSQTVGEFLDWLRTEESLHLMRWGPLEGQRPCPVFDCDDGDLRSASGRVIGECGRCNGTGWIPVERDDWQHDGRSPEKLLADYFGIDLTKLEDEKQAMLDAIRAS